MMAINVNFSSLLQLFPVFGQYSKLHDVNYRKICGFYRPLFNQVVLSGDFEAKIWATKPVRLLISLT